MSYWSDLRKRANGESLDKPFHFIYGKTIDGRDIALDGRKVELFGQCSSGITEITFNSGQKVLLLDEDELWDDLGSLNESTINVTKPLKLVQFDGSHISPGYFNSNAVEFLIYFKQNDKDCMELHFDSGQTFIVTDIVLIREDLTKENIENILEDYIYRHKK